ncbi:MAG: hypothetical protein V1738_04530 [Patescibacteria group bacterium]
MNVQFVGMKEFRQNMATIADRAHKKKQHIIIMRKNKPVFELRPIEPTTEGYAEFLLSLQAARGEIANGKAYSSKKVEDMLGL